MPPAVFNDDTAWTSNLAICLRHATADSVRSNSSVLSHVSIVPWLAGNAYASLGGGITRKAALIRSAHWICNLVHQHA